MPGSRDGARAREEGETETEAERERSLVGPFCLWVACEADSETRVIEVPGTRQGCRALAWCRM